ncbi:MAG: IPT/TIG domain-containing protein, partial [Candidatus Hydrogenedentes bacterium]|nr:IPT/TIG domain-containing protein [Candidatus Hydrogenedentota bacterium]
LRITPYGQFENLPDWLFSVFVGEENYGWSLHSTEAGPYVGEYQRVTLDVSQFTDGQTHRLLFQSYFNDAWIDIDDVTIVVHPQLVQDPSFEAGYPNPNWTFFSHDATDDEGCSGYEYSDINLIDEVPGNARTGQRYLRLGGDGLRCPYDLYTAGQEVLFPAGGLAVLEFYVRITPFGDFPILPDWLFSLFVGDGGYGWSLHSTEVAPYVGEYQRVTLDVSQFADGQAHRLLFQSYFHDAWIDIDDVTIVATGGCSPLPQILSVDPSSGPIEGGYVVTVNGSGFSQGPPAILFGNMPVLDAQVIYDNQVEVLVPPATEPGWVDIQATNNCGTATLFEGFYYEEGGDGCVPPPGATLSVDEVIPNSGPLAGGNEVLITGTGLSGTNLRVYFGSHEATIVPKISSDTITVIAPPGDGYGTVDVRVEQSENPANYGILCQAYTYSSSTGCPPVITSLNPGAVLLQEAVEITIRGIGFSQAIYVYFNGIPATSVEVISDTELTATTPAFYTPGSIDVTVVSLCGEATSPNSLIVEGSSPDQPSVFIMTPISPVRGLVGLEYIVWDANFDRVSLNVSWSTDGGVVFQPATMGFGGDGQTLLTTAPDGVLHTFAWDSRHDLGLQRLENVLIRMSVEDTLSQSNEVLTEPFTVDNQAGGVSVVGTVRNQVTALPIADVLVELFDLEATKSIGITNTDASGRYEIAAPDTTTFLRIAFSRSGYDSRQVAGFRAPNTVNVSLTPSGPQPPTGINAVAGAGVVLLRWRPNTEPDLLGYNVYRGDNLNGPFSRLNSVPVSDTRYEDTTVTNGLDYYYELTAVDADENESSPSLLVHAVSGQIVVTTPDVSGGQGDEIRIPINVANATGIDPAGIDIDFRYDAALVHVAGIRVERTAITAQVFPQINTNEPGRIRISAVGSADTLRGEGHLFDIYMTITEDAPLEQCGALRFADVKFYDPTPSSLNTDFSDLSQLCVNTACLEGDLNGDGEVDSADTIIALKIAVGLVVPQGCQSQAGDLNGDGTIDSADALMIQRKGTGLPLNPAQPGQKTVGPDLGLIAVLKVGEPITVSLPTVNAVAGGTVDVPVIISDATGLSGLDLTVGFPAGLVSVETVLPGFLTVEFSQSVNYGTGFVNVSMSKASALSKSQKVLAGTLAVLRLRIAATVADDTVVPLTLSAVDLKGQYGDSFTWYTQIVKQGGEVTVQAAAPAGAVDVDASGFVDAVDVQLVINAALGLQVPYNCDVDNTGSVDAVDVQKTINGALGLPV